MKEDILKNFKKEYEFKLKEKENNDKCFEVLMNRKTIMENSPMIRDYIELCNQIEEAKEKLYSTQEVFSDVLYDFETKGLVDETNGILLYAGTFMTDFGSERNVHRDSIYAEYDKYIDIESFDEVLNPIEDREFFEKTNTIINLNISDPARYVLYDIRDEFINDALAEGQEVACKKILSRYKKN